MDGEKRHSPYNKQSGHGDRPLTGIKPKVTVLMPVHNGMLHVATAIDSILAQTFKNFELLVVNDGSSDGTGSLLDAYGKKDTRVRIIHLPQNLGIVAALNKGLELCTGQYIARMDSDDIAIAYRLAIQTKFLDEHPDYIACGSDVLLFGAEFWYARYPRTSRECNSYLTMFPCFAHGAVMLRHKAMAATRYEEGYPLAEDYRLWTRLAALGKLANIPRPLMRYRVHSKQNSVLSLTMQRESHCRIAAEMLADTGLPNMDATLIRRFLWPRASDFKQGRKDYMRHACSIISRLWDINGAHCRWLRARLFRVAVRNLLLLQ